MQLLPCSRSSALRMLADRDVRLSSSWHRARGGWLQAAALLQCKPTVSAWGLKCAVCSAIESSADTVTRKTHVT